MCCALVRFLRGAGEKVREIGEFLRTLEREREREGERERGRGRKRERGREKEGFIKERKGFTES